MQPCKAMTDTLAPVERTNWALSAWNSTPDRNDVPPAWLYGQDHLWATGHLLSSPGEVFPPLNQARNNFNHTLGDMASMVNRCQSH